MNFVILAGGVGERLWPLGTPEKPKQFHALVGDEPMIVDAVKRLQPLLFDTVKSEGNLFISTTEQLWPLCENLLFPKQVQRVRHIFEPARRDTGPAMVYVAKMLVDSGQGDEPVAFIPSDHVIKNQTQFVKTLQIGEALIKETGKMMDIGVPAKFGSTVLGYTHVGKKLETRDGVDVYEFLGHTEKPDAETAEKYVASGEYLWHANYYMWTPRKIMEACKTYAPALHDDVMRAVDNPDAYNDIPKISFDYAITEHMNPNDVEILKGDFGWSDVGAWDVLASELAKAPDENVTRGAVTALDSTGSVIYSTTGRKVGVLGLRDMVVVDTPDGLLVCPKNRAQEVKKLVAELNK